MNFLTIKHIIVFILISMLGCCAVAKNCGVIGTVYPITEIDLRTVIQQRLVDLQQSGQLIQLQAKLNSEVQEKMNRPQPVADVSRTVTSHTRLFDPSIRFPYDLKNADGQTVISAGTTINPLDTVSLPETLLFYDADDPEQVRWAERMDRALKGNDKLILVKGSIVQQQTLFKKPMFFDQNGLLTKRFQLTHIPALISQAGDRLKIEEIVP